MHLNPRSSWCVLAALGALPAVAITLTAQQGSSLLVSGQQGAAKVIQVQGHNYVEVEGLAKLTNGSLSFKGNQIVLTLPGSAVAASAQNSAAAVSAPGFSKDFLTASIEMTAQVREWHTALRTAIERSLPVSADWLGPYSAQTLQALRLASIAINTDSDKSAYPFLIMEANNMKKLSDKYMDTSKSMTYIAPTSLQSDPLDQKVLACGHSLASMATTKEFVDDGSCQ